MVVDGEELLLWLEELVPPVILVMVVQVFLLIKEVQVQEEVEELVVVKIYGVQEVTMQVEVEV